MKRMLTILLILMGFVLAGCEIEAHEHHHGYREYHHGRPHRGHHEYRLLDETTQNGVMSQDECTVQPR